MASSRMLTGSISSHLLPRRSFRTQSFTFTIPHSRAPATHAATSIVARKTVPASTPQINPLGRPAARPSRSLHPNSSPFIQPPFRFRRQFHKGQPLSFFDRQPSFLPWTIIALCGSCFVYAKWTQIRLKIYHDSAPDQTIRRNFLTSLANYREGRWWTLLTPNFMHFEIWHFAVNMYAFFSFGTDAVSLLGPQALVVTWIGAGVFSSVAYLISKKIQENQTAKSKSKGSLSGDETKTYEDIGSLGASGSVYGVLTLLACMVPRSPMQLAMLSASFPLWWGVVGSAGFSIAAMQFGWLPGVAHDAHLGGMLFGALYFVFLRARMKGGLKSWIGLQLFK